MVEVSTLSNSSGGRTPKFPDWTLRKSSRHSSSMCLAESKVEPGCTLVPGGAEVDQLFNQVRMKTWPCSRAYVACGAQEAMHVVVKCA